MERGSRPAASASSLNRRDFARKEPTDPKLCQTSAYRAARALLRETVASAWTAAQAGHALGPEHRRLLRLAATNAATASAAVVETLFRTAGGTAVYDASALQRVFRDVNVASQHAMVAPRTYELVGRMALGQSTDIAQL